MGIGIETTKATNQDGKSVLVMPSLIYFQGKFSLKKSSSSAVGRSFCAHSSVLALKGETGGRDGSGKLCLEKEFLPSLGM